jgi:hypothetical protein
MVSPRCNKKIPTRNSFDALNNLIDTEEVENPHKNMVPGKGTVKDKKILEPILEQISGQNPQAYTTRGKISDHDDSDIIMNIDEN